MTLSLLSFDWRFNRIFAWALVEQHATKGWGEGQGAPYATSTPA